MSRELITFSQVIRTGELEGKRKSPRKGRERNTLNNNLKRDTLINLHVLCHAQFGELQCNWYSITRRHFNDMRHQELMRREVCEKKT